MNKIYTVYLSLYNSILSHHIKIVFYHNALFMKRWISFQFIVTVYINECVYCRPTRHCFDKGE